MKYLFSQFYSDNDVYTEENVQTVTNRPVIINIVCPCMCIA